MLCCLWVVVRSFTCPELLKRKTAPSPRSLPVLLLGSCPTHLSEEFLLALKSQSFIAVLDERLLSATSQGSCSPALPPFSHHADNPTLTTASFQSNLPHFKMTFPFLSLNKTTIFFKVTGVLNKNAPLPQYLLTETAVSGTT